MKQQKNNILVITPVKHIDGFEKIINKLGKVSFKEYINYEDLLKIINKTLTASGSRLIKKRLLAPSNNKNEIIRRHKIAEFLYQNKSFKEKIYAKCKTKRLFTAMPYSSSCIQ